MKKIIAILALALALPAANAFAISTSSATAPAGLKGFNATNKVNTYYVGNAASSAWAGVAAHHAGDKEYWTSSAFGGIAFKTVTPGSTNGTTAAGAPSTPTDSTVASGYTTM